MQSVRLLARRVVGNGFSGARNISTSRPGLGKSGAREEQLLANDPVLSKYHETKTQVQLIERFGDVLVILVAAGAIFEISYKMQMRKAASAEEASKVATS